MDVEFSRLCQTAQCVPPFTKTISGDLPPSSWGDLRKGFAEVRNDFRDAFDASKLAKGRETASAACQTGYICVAVSGKE